MLYTGFVNMSCLLHTQHIRARCACLIYAVDDACGRVVPIWLEVNDAGCSVCLSQAPEEGRRQSQGSVQQCLIDGIVSHDQCAPDIVHPKNLLPCQRCAVPELPADRTEESIAVQEESEGLQSYSESTCRRVCALVGHHWCGTESLE